MPPLATDTGTEWIVDAAGCRPDALRDLAGLQHLCARIVRDVGLAPAAEPVWKQFGGASGVTGLLLLAESHLTVHTFPEHGYAALNLYCCAPRPAWDWHRELAAALGATTVDVRTLARPARRLEGERDR